LEAVDGNRSAEVMTVANQLLDAGNSPAQLARQCVRYLRNCLIAKIAGLGIDGAGSDGIGGELLQISADEQRRAARSASLFSEEELTRFLQVMLRTFDELGYRQEQRFHFELGLLKLVHLRRLLPVEEVLSSLSSASPAGASTRTASPARPVTKAPTPPHTPPASIAPTPARPAFSPFEQDKNRRRYDSSSSDTPTSGSSALAPTMRLVEPAPMTMPTPIILPDSVPLAVPSPLEETVEREEEVPLPAPVLTSSPANGATAAAGDAGDMQRIVVEALSGARLASAADAMGDAVWTMTSGEANVQTELSKTMLPVVMNAEAEKVARNALRTAGILKLTLLPGTASATGPAKKPRAAKSGSAQAKAMEHPVVQQAQRLFNAEIRNVIDLRDE
jgi:DNA polymerase-3 subunit gamma/tau